MIHQHATQRFPLLGQISAGSVRASGSYVSPAINAGKFGRLLGLLQVGTLTSTGTVNLRFQHNSNSVSSHSGWADINSTSCITSTYGSAQNGSVAFLELNVEQRPATSQFVRAFVQGSVNSWNGAVQVFGADARYEPSSDDDIAEVAAITVF